MSTKVWKKVSNWKLKIWTFQIELFVFREKHEFCKKFDIEHVNDLEWVYRETGVACHNTDPRDEWCPYNNDRTGDKHTSGLQYSIEEGNHSYSDRHAWYRPDGHHYQRVITSEHPNFKEAKRKETK